MSAIDAFGRHHEPTLRRLRQVELPDMFKRSAVAGLLFEHFQFERHLAARVRRRETPLHDSSARRAVVGTGDRGAALPLADSLVGNHRFAVMGGCPGVARLMLGVVGIGIEQPRRIGQVQHPLADVVRVARVIASQRHKRASPLKRVHGECIAFAVGGAADQAVDILAMPAIGDHAPARSRLRPTARFKALVHELGDVVVAAQFGVHACGGECAIGQQHFVERTLFGRPVPPASGWPSRRRSEIAGL